MEKLQTLLRRLRTERNMSVETLAARARIAPSTLRRWENGRFQPRLPELKTILTTLGAPQTTFHYALTLIEAPRAIQPPGVLQVASKLEDCWMPGPGDLWKAMRCRRSLTASQVAAHLRIHPSLVSRWEKSQSAPPTERLDELFTLLGAYSEEKAALKQSRYHLTPWSETIPTLETCESRLQYMIEQTKYGTWLPGDLGFLTLEAQIWPMARQNSYALHLLAKTWAVHADYLLWRGRKEEMYRYAQRALETVHGMQPEPFWYMAGGLCARYVRHKPRMGGVKRALHDLEKWEPLAVKIQEEHGLYRDMAELAAEAGQTAPAFALLDLSRRLALERELISDVRMADIIRVRILLSTNPTTAISWMAADINWDPNGVAIETELWIELCLKLNDRKGAMQKIQEYAALLESHDMEFRRPTLSNLLLRLDAL